MSVTDFDDTLLVQSPSENVRCYEDLSAAQQKYYDRIVKKQQANILSDWKGVIEQYLEYRKPFLVDAYQLNSRKYSQRCPNLYVLPVFMPAGKHTYLVKNMDTLQYTMHQTICDYRTEDPPILIKDLHYKQMQRVFNKDNSVFKDWKEDTELTLQLACESDLSNSKLSKIIKDPFELTKMYDGIYEEYKHIKLLFLQQSCHSVFPYITSIDFQQNFVSKFMPTTTNKEKSHFDVVFAASCSRGIKGQHKVGLNRQEFTEILVRIAMFKYVDTKIVKKPVDAFKKLLKEDILANWTITPPW